MKIEISKLVHGGSGVGDIDGKFIFVPYSAPDDLLDVEIVEDHATWAEAKISSVIEPASCRVLPPCPVFGICGGCQWQHISYEAQLEWKREILKESLERIGKIVDPRVLPTMASPKEWHYRNKIQLHVDSDGRVGFYKPKSKVVVEFDECLIADERLNEELKKRRHEISSRDCGIALRIESGTSFLQINSEQNERIKGLFVDWLSSISHRAVLELYAGTGNFTFEIAKIAERVVASDVDGRAIDIAKKKVKEMAVSNIEFIRSPSGRATKRMQGDCDVVILDPPRKGCEDAVADILMLKPLSIIYISCNPATLARDLREFLSSGYHLVKSLPVDMFPQTFHVESMTLLRAA